MKNINILKNRGKIMKVNYLQYVPIAEYSNIFGHEMDDIEFKQMLSKIGCQKAISILSRFSSLHNAVCNYKLDAIDLDWKLRMVHSRHIRELGGNEITYNGFETIMCSQSIFLLEKIALIYCPIEDQVSPIILDDLLHIMDALLVINDMLPNGDVHSYETEYLYLTLYHNTHRTIMNQFARAFYIFSEIAKSDTKTTDFLSRYEQSKGFSVEERLAVLFYTLEYVIPEFTIDKMFSKLPCVNIKKFDSKQLTPVYDKIMQSMCSDYDDIKKRVDKLATQVWNFEPFYRTPFIRIGDLCFALSETAIVYQMWDGLYWDIRFSIGKEGKNFMTCFGKPFESYVQKITCAAVENAPPKYSVLFQREFLYKYNGDGKASSDCYFRIGDVLIAVEVKAKSPHSDTLTGVSRAAINTEVDELMTNPVIQTITRLKEIYSHNNDISEEILSFFSGIEKTIILSVSMEKVQPIGELLFSFDAQVKPYLSGTNVVCYHNISIEDYEVICNLIENCPNELPTILTSWYEDQRLDKCSAVVLANYLSKYGKQYTCSRYILDIFEKSLQDISLRTFGKDITSIENN